MISLFPEAVFQLLECELQGERVLLYGQAVRFMDGVIELPD